MKWVRIFRTGLAIGVVLLLVVACGQTSNEGLQQQLDRAKELTANVEQLRGLVQETTGEVGGLEERVANAEQQLSGFEASADLPALERTVGIPDPPTGTVAFRLSFQYQPEPLPGDGIRAYEPTSEVNSLWAMESLSQGQSLPVGPAIEERTLFLEPGESRMVTLAYENPSSEKVGFLVLPHQESPDSLGPHVWPTCLCMSFVYEAPPAGSWYRVIRMTASPDIPPGSRVDVLWMVLTDPALFPKE